MSKCWNVKGEECVTAVSFPYFTFHSFWRTAAPDMQSAQPINRTRHILSAVQLQSWDLPQCSLASWHFSLPNVKRWGEKQSYRTSGLSMLIEAVEHCVKEISMAISQYKLESKVLHTEVSRHLSWPVRFPHAPPFSLRPGEHAPLFPSAWTPIPTFRFGWDRLMLFIWSYSWNFT